MRRIALVLALVGAAQCAPAVAGESAPCPASTITTGSGDVVVEGKSAARAGDRTGCGDTVVQGSPDVFINGKPAAVQGDATGCGGTIVSGGNGVFINGKPMGRVGDATGCPGK